MTSKWLQTVADSAPEKYKGSCGTFNQTVLEGVKTGCYWMKAHDQDEINNKVDLEDNILMENPRSPLQDMEEQGILFGSDVVALYPNLDGVNVAAIAADVVKKTSIRFERINYSLLIVYLTLVLGVSQLARMGLGQCTPVKRDSKNKSNSLLSTQNRDINSWRFDNDSAFTEEEKGLMLGALTQVMVILMTSSTCYRFDGEIYRQRDGLGIGLRASAALARQTMCCWDNLWAKMQYAMDLKVLAFFRYVDDLRFYLRPITKGWVWLESKWQYIPDKVDNRTPHQRTVDEIGKSLPACISDFRVLLII